MKNWVVALVLALVVCFAVPTGLIVLAQGDGDREGEDESPGVGGQGLADPPPSGLSVLYTFTGARYVSGTAATSVHCTNYGSESATVRVEIYDFDNVSSATFSGQATVASNRTATFSTGNTQFYDEDVSMSQPSSEAINQGSGRVMSNKRTLICTAQVLDPAHTQPWFAVQLALHYPDGTPVNAYYNAAVYLPTILRSD